MQTSIKYLMLAVNRTLCFHENSFISICNITKMDVYIYIYIHTCYEVLTMGGC